MKVIVVEWRGKARKGGRRWVARNGEGWVQPGVFVDVHAWVSAVAILIAAEPRDSRQARPIEPSLGELFRSKSP